MSGLGLLVLVVGVDMVRGTNNILIPMSSALIGGILGELMCSARLWL